MGYEALEQIQKLATERFNLYRSAGAHQLTPPQLERLHQIENQLPVLWDQHRREVATVSWARGRDTVPQERITRAA